MTNGTQPTFELGLAMAGAISAGAYAAGAMDFLIEALDEWEKQRGKPGIPNHRVVIKVVSGASAGAITGALGVVALGGGLSPSQYKAGPLNIRAVMPNLYDAWVVKPCLVGAPGKPDLLSLEDIQAPKPAPKDWMPTVASVLNSSLLDEIREAAFKLPPAKPNASLPPFPYFAADLHVYLTVTNLRGVPYGEPFSGGSYGMQCHGDRVHYVVRGLGAANRPSAWSDGDAREAELNIKDLSPKPTDAWVEYGKAAVASGAFPVGLAPRLLKGHTKSYRKRYMPIDMPTQSVPGAGGVMKEDLIGTTPSWPSPWFAAPNDREFDFLCVDGGVINNEPFEYARFALMDKPPRSNERFGETADRAVLMIDPFPEPPDFLADGKPAADLVSVASALFPALINQARFKPSELADASHETVYSRFLIAPKRSNKGREAFYAIACGVLGGFGGFLDERFRQHDFQLGRRNCQRFLKESFALPGNNTPIISTWTDEQRNNKQCRTEPDKKGEIYFRIIPIVGSADVTIELPDESWPRMNAQDFEKLQKRIETRVVAITPIIIERQTKSRFLRPVLKVASVVAKSYILKYVRYAILSDLIRRDQIEGWTLPKQLDNDQTRAVLAELASPAMDLRTVKGIARATRLPEKEVAAILKALLGFPDRPFSIWAGEYDGKQVYTLQIRRPASAKDWPIVGGLISGVSDWFSAPTVDEE